MALTHRSFPVPRARLFGVLAEPLRYPDWLVGAKRIRAVAEEWPAPGSWFDHVTGVGPLVFFDRTTVVHHEPPVRLELIVRVRPVLVARVRFDLVDEGATALLRMTETPQGIHRIGGPFLEPLVRVRNDLSLRRLAAVVDELDDG